ncbi:odorant receptor 59a-like [Rhagoletis pomonella]|uniref:odorant receptor 59a-like n=1 Tax=Rhagoletis pomonella TaxID=28610 RepID=UPI001780E648|nr:odorant receptor 59a-like [Rhagoletis pomonella]
MLFVMENVKSGISAFRFHDITWRYVGQRPPSPRYRYIYYLYSLILNIIVTFGYPTHLMIGLIQSESKADIFKNITINLTCLGCSIKTLAFWWRLADVRKIYALIQRLDQQIIQSDDVQFYNSNAFRRTKQVLYFDVCVGLGASIASEVATLIAGVLGNWRLMYPAYFPFDYEHSVLGYIAAHFYQCFGVTVQIFQNIINDSFPPMALAMLAVHVRLLNMRLVRIGQRRKRASVTDAELLQCVEDYKALLDFRAAIQRIASIGTFVQILVTAINMGVVIVYLIFYVNDIFSYVYYLLFLVAMPLEIFPHCYYGTVVEMEFRQLTYAIFSCNWIDKSAAFKKNLLIFGEQSLRKQIVIAGGMFAVNLDTFFATLKGAYSLFALVFQMK